MSDSGTQLIANVIIKQVFGDVLQCFMGGVSFIQVADILLEPQFFEINFSNFTVGLPYLLPSLTFCYSELTFFNPHQWIPSFQE
jgi:hypothetical protein